jgi:hypothetical protein
MPLVHSFTIVSVAPPDFRGTELFFAPDLWGSHRRFATPRR